MNVKTEGIRHRHRCWCCRHLCLAIGVVRRHDSHRRCVSAFYIRRRRTGRPWPRLPLHLGAILRARDLVVTTYAMLTRQPWLAEVDWRLVILDEAQAIKNPSTRQSRTARKLPAQGRIALTGNTSGKSPG